MDVRDLLRNGHVQRDAEASRASSLDEQLQMDSSVENEAPSEMMFVPQLPISEPAGTDPLLLVADALDVLKSLPTGSVNLIISSPPYNIGKVYERGKKLSLGQYLRWQQDILIQAKRVLAENGTICWQTGTYIDKNGILPLDIPFARLFSRLGFKLRNRIIWRFNFGLHSDKRFSGRYETLLWLTKSDSYKFNLDPVRIPQLYPGKRHPRKRVDKQGELSGNPKGKNPSDYWEFDASADFLHNPVWNFPNVKNNHPEKQDHPCQFPIELAERCVLAFTEANDMVVDPFVGTGSAVLAAQKHGRRSIGVDKEDVYVRIAQKRSDELREGRLAMRSIGRPVATPPRNSKLTRIPEEWSAGRGEEAKA